MLFSGGKNVGGFLLGDGNECLHDAGVKLGFHCCGPGAQSLRVWKSLPVAAIRDIASKASITQMIRETMECRFLQSTG